MKRAMNFCDEEVSTLVTLVLDNFKNAIENKITNARSNREKHAAWETLTNIYNQINPHSRRRAAKTLRLKYENIKKLLRKKIGRMKLERTGPGGISTATELKDYERPLIALLGTSSDGLSIQYDNKMYKDMSEDSQDPEHQTTMPNNSQCVEILFKKDNNQSSYSPKSEQHMSNHPPFAEMLFKQEIPEEDRILKGLGNEGEDVDVMQSLINFATTSNLDHPCQNEPPATRQQTFKKRHRRMPLRDPVLNNTHSFSSATATNLGQPSQDERPTLKKNHKKIESNHHKANINNILTKYDLLADRTMEYLESKISIMNEESLLTKEVLRRKAEMLELEKELLQYRINEFKNK